jgi:hypothetical protein
MRCYYVLVHGKLTWLSGRSPTDAIGETKPTGFYCHRYVLASSEAAAIDAAFHRIRSNLDREMGWLREGFASVELHADKIANAPMHKLLKPDNRGHTFYVEE